MLTLTTLIILIIGAINYLAIGIFQKDLPSLIFGGASTIGARIIYIIIGLMSLWLIYIVVLRRDVISYKNDFNFKKPKHK